VGSKKKINQVALFFNKNRNKKDQVVSCQVTGPTETPTQRSTGNQNEVVAFERRWLKSPFAGPCSQMFSGLKTWLISLPFATHLLQSPNFKVKLPWQLPSPYPFTFHKHFCKSPGHSHDDRDHTISLMYVSHHPPVFQPSSGPAVHLHSTQV
jgi:hypothetical protein